MDNHQEFLKWFNELERYLRIEYNNGRYSESSFMGTLYQIKARKSNALIASKENFDILSLAAQLRNLMVHNENIAMPTDAFLEEFRNVVQRITHPKRVWEVMMPINRMYVVTKEATVAEVVSIMKKEGYANIPVMADGRLVGVFTRRTLYHAMVLHPDLVIRNTLHMNDILDAMDLDYDPARYFDFIPRSLDIYQALESFGRDFEIDRELEILFVTEHGEKDEKIQGIVTIWDLKQAFLAASRNSNG